MVKKYTTRAAKTKKRERKLKMGIKKAQKMQHKEKDVKINFPAIELLNDPQGFAEKLLAELKHTTERFEVPTPPTFHPFHSVPFYFSSRH
jgi:protein SDA1